MRMYLAAVTATILGLFATVGTAVADQEVSFAAATAVNWRVIPSATARIQIDGPVLLVRFDRLTFK